MNATNHAYKFNYKTTVETNFQIQILTNFQNFQNDQKFYDVLNENNNHDIMKNVNIDLIKKISNSEKSNVKMNLINFKKTMELVFQKTPNPQMFKIMNQIEFLIQNSLSSHDMFEFEIINSKLDKIINEKKPKVIKQNTFNNFQNGKSSWVQTAVLNAGKTFVEQVCKLMNHFENKNNALSFFQIQ